MNRRALYIHIVLAVMLSVAAALGQQMSTTQIAGGGGGSPFADGSPASGSRIIEVRIHAGDTVDAVQLIYGFADGNSRASARHGGGGGREFVFRLDSDEYITGISGRYGDTVDSIRIHTNKRTSPTYGGGGGSNDFRIDVPSGSQAVGFVGRAGDGMDAIGLSTAPRSRLGSPFRTRGQGQAAGANMAGGGGGSPFADGDLAAGTRVAEVRIRAGDTVDAVQMIYVLANGSSRAGARHGGSGGREYTFALDSDEYITGISGRCGDTVDSIRFHTNKRTSPTFGGSGGGNDFRFDAPAGNQAIGFVGRAGTTLDAIGLSTSALRLLPFGRRPRRP